MFRALVGNTLISTAAFLVVGLVGLLLVPVLISAYGLGGLGLIMLARLFLPGAGLGLFDFGVSEIATQTLAGGRVDQDWPRVQRRLTALALLTLAMACAVALPMIMFAGPLARAFGVAAHERVVFAQVLQSTAALLPLLFLGLMAEGCLKGCENFRALRSAEVLSTLAFAGAAVLASRDGLGFEWVVWLHLMSQVLRVGLIGWALHRTRSQGLALRRDIDPETRGFLRERARVFITSRLLGTAQHQSPAVLIGLTVGPEGVGMYETLARLPRFAKSVLGILNTTLLPYATRLDAAGDEARLRLLNVLGFTLLPTLVFPPLAVAAGLSAPLLHIWIGENLLPHALWLGLFWALPALNTIVSFQSYVLLSRMSYVKASNAVSAAQVMFQVAVSLLLVTWLNEFAFIVGYIGASALLFGWQLTLARRELGTPPALVVRLLLFTLVLVAVAVGLHFVGLASHLRHWASFVPAYLAATVLLLVGSFAVFLGPAERAMARQVVVLMRQRRR